MANYYMLGGDGKEYGPISAEQLRHWASEGRANHYTQVRTEDDGPWIAFGSVMELVASPGHFAASAVHPNLAHLAAKVGGSGGAAAIEESIKRLASTVASAAGWIRLLSVVMLLNAAVITLCTFGLGIFVAWIPLWLGIVLWTAAGRAQRAVLSGSEIDLQACLDRLRFYFKLNGILLILGLVLFLVLVVLSAAVPSLLPADAFPLQH